MSPEDLFMAACV